ncbi:hypothetical protein HF086_018396 [Spodoptera exigua]|uniref:Gustatory receptor n=1 Tax=Spodoptera exigua TaxID=7107 RepID=A0A922MNK9_SPOEX|nr:hypothetical protein HF086_018396 [Spodoptera exigua]
MIGKRKTLPKPNFQLLNNKLEKEIQGLVYSFNFALKIFCASKYSVRNNRLYPRGNKYQFFAFCFTVFMGFICTYRMFTIDITDPNMSESENDTVNLLSVLYYFLYTIGFTLMFILDSIHKQDNVFFFIEIQAIHLSVDFSKNMRSYIIFNWIYLFMIMFIDIYMYGSFFILYENSTWLETLSDFFCDAAFIIFDVNYVISIRIIILLKAYLDQWIREISIKDEQENEGRYLKLFGSYQHILKAYNLYKKIYRVLVTIHIFPYTFHYHSLMSLYIVLFTSKRFTLSGGGVKSQEWLYKSVKQINRTFSKMSACGLFCVDAALVLCLTGVITNYAVVMLQFTFL